MAARAELLRPDPSRGNLVAGGAVALALLVALVNARFDSEWGQGVHLVYTAAAAFALVAMAAMSPRPAAGTAGDRREEGRPEGWQSVLFVTSFVLVLGTLANLADVLGADEPPFGASGTVVWVGLLLAGLAAWYSRGWDSGISSLLLAVTAGAVALAFVDWVFSPDGADTFRWILLLIALGLGAVGVSRRVTEPDHAVGFVNAAGLALLALALTFAFEQVLSSFSPLGSGDAGGDPGSGLGWELVVLAGAALLILWTITTRQVGPAYLGVANLLAFLALVAAPGEDGASLIGWPLVLALATAALFALSRGLGGNGPPPAPPVGSPPPDEPSEAPTAVHQPDQPRP